MLQCRATQRPYITISEADNRAFSTDAVLFDGTVLSAIQMLVLLILSHARPTVFRFINLRYTSISSPEFTTALRKVHLIKHFNAFMMPLSNV